MTEFIHLSYEQLAKITKELRKLNTKWKNAVVIDVETIKENDKSMIFHVTRVDGIDDKEVRIIPLSIEYLMTHTQIIG